MVDVLIACWCRAADLRTVHVSDLAPVFSGESSQIDFDTDICKDLRQLLSIGGPVVFWTWVSMTSV